MSETAGLGKGWAASTEKQFLRRTETACYTILEETKKIR